MSFIGCNIVGSSGPGSKIYQPITDLADIETCNISTYFNSSTGQEENVAFEKVAPIRMDLDSLVATDNNENDLKNKSWDLDLTALVLFAEQEDFDRYVYITSSVDADTVFMLKYNNATKNVAILIDDSLNNTIIDKGYECAGSSLDSLRVTYDLATTTLKIFSCGVELDSLVITITGNLNVDTYSIASQGDSTRYAPMLLSAFSLTGIGTTDFITNQDKPKTYISSTGLVWTLTEDVVDAGIYPGNGSYTWPTDEVLSQPKIEPIRIYSTNKITDGGGNTSIDYGVNGLLDYFLIMSDNDTDQDTIRQIRSSAHSAEINYVQLTDGRLQVQIRDTTGTLVGIYNSTTDIRGINALIQTETSIVATTLTFTTYINGVANGTDDVPLGSVGDWEFDRFDYSPVAPAPYEGYLYCNEWYLNSTLICDFNFVTRLKPQGETQNEIIDSIANRTLIVSDVTKIYPNLPTGSYLISDTHCGDNRLLIRDNIAQIRDGVWQYAAW